MAGHWALESRLKTIRKGVAMYKKSLKSFAILGCILLLCATCWAGVTGSISGTVTDSSGSVVPQAQVIVTEVNTNTVFRTTTNGSGNFNFLALPVGQYRLEVQAVGFKTYQRTGIALDANDALNLDVSLQVGTTAETVEVSADAVHVDTISTASGDVIGSKKIESLPLNGRQYTDLLGLQPGVVPVSAGTIPGSGNYAATAETGNISISGNRETANGFVVNGGNVEEDRNNGAAIIPNLDSIAEFRVLTNAFDAEYGYYSGGMVNVITKSGTNDWHGSAFEFLRNTDLDAKNFYDIQRGVFRQNQFGGTLGGPAIKDKLFFFIDYQGTRSTQGLSSGLVPVPTAEERAGNFSAIVDSLTGTVTGPYLASQLSQKLGYTVSSGENFFGANCTTNTQCVFPNAIIPQSVWDPAAAGMLKYIPTATQGSNFVSSGNNQILDDNRGGARIDYNSRFGLLSFYYFIGDTSTYSTYGANNVPGFPTLNLTRGQQFNIGLTTNFGSTKVNELRFNFTRFVAGSSVPGAGIAPGTLSNLGFAVNVPGGITPGAPSYEGVPAVSFNNYNFGAPAIVYDRHQGNPQIMDNFSIVRGRHTLKFGAQDMLTKFIQSFPLVGGNGFMSFNGSETGDDFADYLIGAMNSFTQESPLYISEYKNYIGIYGQDSWRVTPNLTVNYGLRWDYIPSWTENNDEKYTYALGVQSKIFPTAPTGVLYPGDTIPGYGKIPATIARTPKDNFSPRIGLAYSPSAGHGLLGDLFGGPGKSSFRVSYGIFYTNIEGIQTYNSDPPPPYVVYTSFSNVFLSRPYTNLANGVIHPDPFPFVEPKPGQDVNFLPLLPIVGFAAIDIHNVTPYSENYQLNFQRQLANNLLFSAAYVGGQGHHLLATLPINPGSPSECLALSNPAAVAPGSPTCGPFGEDLTYTLANGTTVYGTRGPFGDPNFGDNTSASTIANSTYNSFQSSLQYRSSHASFLAGYTFSKTMDNSSGFNNEPIYPFDPKVSRSLSNFDITHYFVISYDYELPFYKLTSNSSSRLTSGWRLLGITRFSSGLPVSMADSSDNSLLGTFGSGIGPGIDTPNYTGAGLQFQNPRSGKAYFNTSAFYEETLGKLGDANRRFFHGPGLNNWDMSLIKDLRVTERTSLQFRAEFFNIFNHAQFMNPDGNFSHSTFGYVTSARDPRIGQLAIKFLF
jgi:Carboxypeptidase regulatory-like domain